MKFKILIFILCGLSLVSALVFAWPTLETLVFEAKLHQISGDWLKYNRKPLAWYHTDRFGCYYLGSDNGYDIFYYDTFSWPGSAIYDTPSEDELREYGTISIGGNTFYPCSRDQLMVYKDGTFDELSITHIRGNISDKAVANAANSFNAYMEIIRNTASQDFWEAEKTFWNETLENWETICKIKYQNGTPLSEADKKYLQSQDTYTKREITEYLTNETSPKYEWYQSWFNGIPIE